MKRLGSWVALIALVGCGGGDAGGGRGGPTGSRGVTQGGAQDIAYFRSLVEEGRVPEPDTIEPVGFFAEHQVDLPLADCGESVCIHPMLAVTRGIDHESNWTMAFVAMNTPVDPRELPRPETHVVLVIEDTERTAITPELATTMIRALTTELLAGDRVSIVRVGAGVTVLANGLEPSDPAIAAALGAFRLSDPTAALYDGLATAAQIVEDLAGFDSAHRVVLVTSGVADAGVTDSGRIVGLGEALARDGVGVSVVGVGSSYRPEIGMQISEGGGGSYYFAESADDLEEIFRLEGRTSLYPLATDFQLVIEAAPGYRVRRVYGGRRAYSDTGAAYLASPVLMIGNRTGASDVAEGRRGGGGGLFIELIADPAMADEIGAGAAAFTARASWMDPASGLAVSQEIVVENSLAPGRNPSGSYPLFSDPARGKAFMMLNMYLSLRSTTELFHAGDCAQALGVFAAMAPGYDAWQAEHADPDIDADWELLSALDANVAEQCASIAPEAPYAPMGCFFFGF